MSGVRTINPATEESLANYELHTGSALEQVLEASVAAQLAWRELKLAARLDCVADFAQILHAARRSLAELMTSEMGKTLKESLAEVDKSALSCKALCEQYPLWLAQKEYATQTGYHISRQALGVTLGIMPWNYPLWQVVRFALPSLLCGNSVLIKHAPNTWGSAEFIADLFAQALPEGLYLNLRMDVDGTSKLIADPRVRGVSLTGSRAAGVSVASQAGAALKKCVLELGGSDAYVVLDDADVDYAAEICTQARLVNAGQSCIAAKRFVVTRRNVLQFTAKMHALFEAKKFGDPLSSRSDLGPMARRDLRDQLHAQVEKSVRSGAKLILGGYLPSGPGFYYPPSLLVDVRPGQVAFDEELFGPVAAVITAADENEAFALANRSRYGLGGAIFSRDIERARLLAAREMDCGMVAINDFVRSDASAPFGGVKDSGLGRELGREGSFEFSVVKSVFVPPR